MPKGEYQFGGFREPTYTMVPDELFDELLPELTGNELKVLLYIIRRTMGFRKKEDLISLSQFTDGITKKDGDVLDRGAGVSKEGASTAVKGLVSKGIIEALPQTAANGGYAPTLYRLRFASSAPSQENRQALSRKPARGSQETSPTLVNDSDIQETDVTINSRQESIAVEGLTAALSHFDKEIGGGNTFGIALERATALCRMKNWTPLELIEQLRKIKGGTIAKRLEQIQ